MPQHDSPAPPTSRPRILVIDDSRVVRLSLKKVLSNEFEITEAEDGEAGWKALLGDPHIQVVLTDADMPRLDGYQLIQRIRDHEDQRLNTIPVNMVTAADDEAARQRALTLGATDFITKPFDKAQLLARVRAQARLDQTTRELAQTAEALVEQATDDALTGVRSRRYLLKRGEQDLAFARRHGQELSLLVISLDKASELASQYGDTVLDQLLTHVAATLQAAIRKEDTLARLGPSQFAIIAPTLGGAEAFMVCRRILQQIAAEPASASGMSHSITASLGLSGPGLDKLERFEDFLTHAEQQAMHAQHAGGNRLLPEAPSQTATKKRVSIDAALRVLASGDPQRLVPHMTAILERLLPLLEYGDQQRQWGATAELASLRQKAGLGEPR